YDRRGDSAAHGEIANDFHASRLGRGAQVVEDAVRDRLVEGALVAVAPQVELERLELDTKLIRHVLDPDAREVGLPRERAKARELRTIELDQVVPLRPGVGEGLEVLGGLGGHGSLTRRSRRNRLNSAVHTTFAAGRLVLV